MQKILFRRKNKKNLFSIICATLGKENNLFKLCESLQSQNYKKFELIICDQNKENFNRVTIKKFKKIKIKFLKTKIGLSKSRNQGIKVASGDFFIFLDDDILLKKNYLKKINLYLNKTNCDILCYKVKNLNKKNLLNYPNFNKYLLNQYEIFNYISSVSFVIKNYKSLNFDENIGLGSKSKYQSGEETDLILKIYKKYKPRIFFLSTLYIFHLEKNIKFLSMIKKNYFYGCGWRYVVNKRELNLKFKFNYIFKIILNIFFHIATLNFKKACFSFATFLGRSNVF